MAVKGFLVNKMICTEKIKRIPLTRGYYTTVDAEDYEWLRHWKWHVLTNKGLAYAGRQYRDHRIRNNKGKSKQVYVSMHRLIMNAPKSKHIDHKDGNGLNNTRSNLRFCTCSENLQNQSSKGRFTSSYKGVVATHGKYQVNICYKGEKIYLGQFTRELTAAKTYDKIAKILFGEFACLNFPEKQELVKSELTQ